MKTFVLFIFISSHYCLGAFEKTESGAVPIAMGNAFVAIPGTFTAIYYNPAALDTAVSFYTQISARNFYGFSGISQIDLISGFQIYNYPVCLGINRYGNSIYQEIQLSTAVSIYLTGRFSVGLTFQAYFLSISGYGVDYSYSANLGLLYKINDQLFCGSMISNINQAKLGNCNELLPQSFSLGFCYFPQDQFTLSAEIFRDNRYPPDFRLGAAYQFEYPIIIRIGLQDAVNSYSFGLGIKKGVFFIDYALQIHQILGESHIFSIATRL